MTLDYRNLTLLGAVLALCGVMLIAPQPAEARQGGDFNNWDLRGSYSFSFDGSLMDPAGPFPLSATGRIDFNGLGMVPGAVRTLNVGGQVFRQTAEGDYTVNPDGTGSAVFTVKTVEPPGALPDMVETFEFVISDNGRLLQFISTTPGVVARGRVERQ